MRSKLKKSQLQEDEVAVVVDGKRQPGSGNRPWKPRDVKSDDFLIECKYTSKGSYRVTRKLLQQIENDALARGKNPALVIGFSKEDMIKDNWIAVPLYVWRELQKK